MMSFLEDAGFNYYIYAPKVESFHRQRWREPYPEAELKNFSELSAACRAHGITMNYGISPGLDMDFNDASEVSRLEEKLLYPSNTQVALFVSLAEGETFRLDSVRIQIDGELVAHHIYSFKELEALRKGGVQRIYTGNIPTGEHRLEVSVSGELPGGRDFSGTESFSFSKDVEPKLVGITLAGPDSGDASIQLGGW